MKFILLFFLLPCRLLAQDITGLWTGFIHTTEKDLPYELAISEHNGKLSGYSHTTFMVNGVAEVGLKAVSIKKDKGSVTVEDDALVFNDFSEAPAKGVKQYDYLSLVVEDSLMMLNGTFKTNKTRVYRPINGTIELRKIDTSKKTKIIPKLYELNLAGSLSFLQPKEKEQVAVNSPNQKNVPVSTSTIQTDTTIFAKVIPQATRQVDTTAVAKVVLPLPKQADTKIISIQNKKPDIVLSKPKDTIINSVVSTNKPAQPPARKVDTLLATNIKPSTVNKTPPASIAKNEQVASAIKKEQTVVNVKKQAEQPVAVSQPKSLPVAPVSNPIIKPVAPSISSAADVAKRKTETIESVFFKSDSLVLNLYDNGEVDGDTVSVVLNGNVILARQGLTTNAITKTIYITPDMGDSLNLVMYAENLGSIPPNTGLLILLDGNDRYEIRFAGDFQKNSAITLRRRKP